MPGYPWLADRKIDEAVTPRKMVALRRVGVPYTDEQIEQASEEVIGKTEMEAMIAYLQVLGIAVKTR
jgi:cytochrome c oxidase cbb3-type subunit 2